MPIIKFRNRREESLPNAPWLYICGEHALVCAYALVDIVPATVLEITQRNSTSESILSSCDITATDSLLIIVDPRINPSESSRLATRNYLRNAARAQSCNFASVCISNVTEAEACTWGPNHLIISARPDGFAQSDASVIHKWLFKILTTAESALLLSDAQLLAVEDRFPDHTYSPIVDAYKHPRSARIKFVGIVLGKPEITDGEKLSWSVADRTGVAHFYYQYRGPQSQYTWDWVVSLKPGDLKVLPRMPMVKIQERISIQLVKLPLRGVANIITGTGGVVRKVGRGIHRVGKTMHMGKSEKWLNEADVAEWLDTPEARRYRFTAKKPVKEADRETNKMQEKQQYINYPCSDDGESYSNKIGADQNNNNSDRFSLASTKAEETNNFSDEKHATEFC